MHHFNGTVLHNGTHYIGAGQKIQKLFDAEITHTCILLPNKTDVNDSCQPHQSLIASTSERSWCVLTSSVRVAVVRFCVSSVNIYKIRVIHNGNT